MSDDGSGGQLLTGACRCGKTRFEAKGPPLATMACHCTGCQHMTGGAFSLSSFYPADRFSVTEGSTVRGGMKTGPDHQFCPDCMSWMFTTASEIDGFVNVRSSLFVDATAHRPFVDMYLSEAIPGASAGAVHSFADFPAENDFPRLMAEYAAWDGRVKA
jgi:hypothetical protein